MKIRTKENTVNPQINVLDQVYFKQSHFNKSDEFQRNVTILHRKHGLNN